MTKIPLLWKPDFVIKDLILISNSLSESGENLLKRGAMKVG